MVFDDKERNLNSRLRTIYDFAMGILWISVGIFFLFQKKLGYDFKIDPVLTGIFGVSSMLYGGFRVYRGLKKN
jgi:hypothetical protein